MLDVFIGRHIRIILLSPYGYRVAKYVHTKIHTQQNQKPRKRGEKNEAGKGRNKGKDREKEKGKTKRETKEKGGAKWKTGRGVEERGY